MNAELLQIKQLALGYCYAVAEGAVRADRCRPAAGLLAVTQAWQSAHGGVRADRDRQCAGL